MALRGSARDKVLEGLRARKPFKNSTGSMRGTATSEGTGRLEGEALEQFRRDQPTYIVYSYATPIAWVTKGGLVRVPSVKYSMTTSQHQSTARYGLDA